MNHVDLSNPAIVVSMSDFQRFKRCRKSSDLTFRHGLEPLADKEAMARGRAFHAMLEAYTLAQMLSVTESLDLERRLRKLKALLAESDLGDMKTVAEQYITRRWTIAPVCLGFVEEPIYTLLLPAGAAWDGKHDERPSPAVYLRTTFDLIYKDADAWVVGRDYKTFAKNVTHDNDLDFQGKIEMAVLQRHYESSHARFEYVNVRQTPPDVVKDAKGGVWREDECYSIDDFYPSEYELQGIWRETQHVARELLGCLASDDPYVWYRTDLKGSLPHACGQCFVKDLCKDEAMFGALSADTIERYAKPREYIVTNINGISVMAEKPREFVPFHGLETA
ncbi:MAG: PD-(D/E)XK nuclease family protein [Candidatus Cybelea sp.]